MSCYGEVDTPPGKPQPLLPPPVPEPVVCAPRPSTRLVLRANLDPHSPISDVAWDATQADAVGTLWTSFGVIDSGGRQVLIAFVLLARDTNVWEYHAVLTGDVIGPELGAGRIVFNPNGTLQRADVWRPLRLPSPDGTLGAPIKLDLGRPTSHGGAGSDGLTSFSAASVLISADHDGRPGAIGPRCLHAGPPAVVSFYGMFSGSGMALDDSYPLCAGSISTTLGSYVLLSRFTPIATDAWDPEAPQGPSDYWTETRVYDAALQAVPLQMRFRRVAEDWWEVHVLVADAGELTPRATLRLDVDGRLAHVEGDRSVYLRLPDGGWGQPLALDFGVPLDERGSHPVDPIVAYQEGNGDIWADGWNPDVCDDSSP